MWLSEITLQLIGFRVVTLLILAGIQGGIVAATAVLLGDKGPRFDGRLTLSPASHIDLVGAIGVIIFGNGWTKPIAIDAGEFRIGRLGIFAVIFAGFAGLVVTAAILDALILPALTSLPHTAALTTAAFLREAGDLAIWFALFSLIPIPPLVGGLVLGALGLSVPPLAVRLLAGLLLVAVATGMVDLLLGPAHALLAPAVLGE